MSSLGSQHSEDLQTESNIERLLQTQQGFSPPCSPRDIQSCSRSISPKIIEQSEGSAISKSPYD